MKTISVRLTNPRSARRWDPFALGYAWAILCAVWILGISLAGKAGYFLPYISLIQSLFPYYSLSASGIIIGTASSALCGLLFGAINAWLYNQFL